MEYNSIKITSSKGTFGTTVEVNGQVVKACRAVTYRHAVDGVAVLTLEMLALGDVLIDGHAVVEIVEVSREVAKIDEAISGDDLPKAA